MLTPKMAPQGPPLAFFPTFESPELIRRVLIQPQSFGEALTDASLGAKNSVEEGLNGLHQVNVLRICRIHDNGLRASREAIGLH